jgi:hypothetical protein
MRDVPVDSARNIVTLLILQIHDTELWTNILISLLFKYHDYELRNSIVCFCENVNLMAVE